MQSQPVIDSSHRVDALCFFRIVKEQNSVLARKPIESVRCMLSIGFQWFGGGERDRTDDLLLAKQALSQLSYTPDLESLVGLVGVEPTTPALSRRCYNQLSYRPRQNRLQPGSGAARDVQTNLCATLRHSLLQETNR